MIKRFPEISYLNSLYYLHYITYYHPYFICCVGHVIVLRYWQLYFQENEQEEEIDESIKQRRFTYTEKRKEIGKPQSLDSSFVNLLYS